MSTIRIRFADDTHEDRDPQSLVSEWPSGQQLTLDECRRSPARLDVWVQRDGEWKAVKVETAREQGWREMYEAEKERADAAEQRLANMQRERDGWERSARDIATGSDARGATIWRLQNRLARRKRQTKLWRSRAPH